MTKKEFYERYREAREVVETVKSKEALYMIYWYTDDKALTSALIRKITNCYQPDLKERLQMYKVTKDTLSLCDFIDKKIVKNNLPFEYPSVLEQRTKLAKKRYKFEYGKNFFITLDDNLRR